MLWILLLLAAAVIFLVSTDRLESVDAWFARLFRKLSLAWAYIREDCEDLELEIREQARAARPAERSRVDPDHDTATVPPGPPDPVDPPSARH
jgi:hypothetical protein